MTTQHANRMEATRMRFGILAPAAALALGLVACDTDVQNPGPVQDGFLDEPAAQEALLNGMGRALAEGINWLAYTSAAVTREIHPSGSTGSFGITPQWQRGILSVEDRNLGTHWDEAQQARWLAEHGIGRIEEAGAEEQEFLALANLYAGYANRLLGEHMCEAVIDGGPNEPHTAFLTRAEAFFTQAAEIGTGDIRTAAVAGRASIRVHLGKWAEAVADAGMVPDGFVYRLPYHNVGSDDQRNRIQYAANNTPYRAHTMWGTKYEDYFVETGDPRVPWRTTELTGDAAIDCCGRVPWWPQDKYKDPGADVTLSSGAEMRLIEAEALLRNNDVAGAMTKINALRTAAGVAPIDATTPAAAWTALKQERGIVLWLEGRRMSDMRRWNAENAPGEFHPLELPGGSADEGSHLAQQDLCFPIPPSERETNPNVS